MQEAAHERRWLAVAAALVTLSCVSAATGVSAAAGEKEKRTDEGRAIQTGVVAVRLRQRGALLVEGFDGEKVDTHRWRVWLSDPERAKIGVEGGRLVIRASGPVGHNGLWQLHSAKYKDVTLVARMGVRSDGPAPHQCLLHLCGGEMPISPDHWVEVALTDQGQNAVFRVLAAAPEGVFTQRHRRLVLPNREDGFLVRLDLNAGDNRCSPSVWDGQRWRPVVDPVELLLRTVHCEVKVRGSRLVDGKPTRSVAWFDDVRIYPRAKTHPVLVRLCWPDGSDVWRREGGRWPPTIRVAGQPEREIQDLVVQLLTADGKTVVASVRSKNMGHYMLPLKDAPWTVYPVAARLRVLLDGHVLGKEVLIPQSGLEGLYPDDVWDLVLQ